ncbi:ABC transporter ATP-binding protein [Shouchella clausii]|uniref:Antimicrobial peptide ABC transporter ATP-binding protein n=3 Tax=Shouchella TaxID=2893057 RepID=Q5WEI4_SHOC1|nr:MULTISPECIES: ABC transporter ATP-binding protein [Shouchella]MCM3313423.1 ABC transporter ATP-binding protein [Psychrobacillus sp. MER TA 17]PAD42585.1 ABC transporter ATP-binding protein [Bacillus sp. 7520-S]ALA54387.1 ABC transporter ATP-binding protein YvcR [Shouchella clausii]AST97036.1 macrolide ABC transporter ATP-binding protein [Shouchella clausii]KKI84718.1 macrolide ABC transporter ATP-binding protein [Shouchella clausii]
MIVLKQVTKSFRVGQAWSQVLAPIDLTIEQESFMSIMGPSGSGKSTLMNIIGCLDKPTTGEYLLDGQMIGTLSEKELAKIRNEKIGFVFQQFHLLPRLSAWKNVELPMVYAGIKKSERKERAYEALKKVGLGDRATYKPASLSGGQKQRVAIARALVNNPSIILADEPTGALDSKTSESIMELLRGLNEEGVTISIITHETEIAEKTDRTVFVKDGKIQEATAS